MARKRGGLAGFWDNNKRIITPAATLLAGALGTPALGAAVGAALKGFDREGKGGIGFDVKRGAMGGLEGYGMGKLGGALSSGIGARLGIGATKAALPGMSANSMIGMTGGKGAMAIGAPSYAASMAPAASSVATAAATALPSGGGGWGGLIKDPKTLAALGQTAVGGMNAYQQSQQNQIQRQQLQRQNDLQDDERRRNQALDPARAALLRQIFSRLGVGSLA